MSDLWKEDVPAFVTKLRELGVQQFEGFGVKIVIGPLPAPAGEKVPDLAAALAPVLCRCGHAKHDHSGNAGCLHGCDMIQCVPEGAVS